ncbi:MAG: DUF373 family protein [archaeon]
MSKVLVLCVDRDDDVGKKTRFKGPIVGEKNNIEVATALIAADPGESDGNTMFEAVRVFRELKKDAVDVVTLTGHPSRGYAADKTLAAQLDSVLKKYGKIDGVYLVTDGADDDEIIPIIHSRAKVISKKTLIIKQAKELEKSYYVIKQLLQEPAFARIVFGLPGVILLTLSFFQELGLKIIIFLIGTYLMLKGFGVEEPVINSFRSFRETTSIERASFPLYIGAFLMGIFSVWAGFEKLSTAQASFLMQATSFISGFATLFIIAVALFLFGRIGDMAYQKETYKIKRYLMSLVSIIAIWTVLLKAVDFIFGKIFLDELILWVLLAFFASIVGLNVVKRLFIDRFVVKHLRKDMDAYDENGDRLGKITEVNRNKRFITVEKKDEKTKISFNKIALVTSEYASIRTR